MTKLNLVTLLVLIFSFTLSAQNNEDTPDKNDNTTGSKFSFTTYAGIGYAVVDNEFQPNYNLDVSTIEFLVRYRILKHFGVATGIGISDFTGSGNYFINGAFYHERTTIKIPLLLSVNYNVSPKIRLIADVGIYGQNISKDDYTFLDGENVTDVFEDWNFGLQSSIGISYDFNHRMSLGLMFTSQGDFDRFNNNSGKGIFVDQQKISRTNTVGLMFGIHF